MMGFWIVAGDQAEGVGSLVEERLQCVEGQSDVCRVLAGGVLVLQARREGQAHQRFLPLVGERALVAVATPKDDAAELGHHAQRVFENVWRNVVAIDEDGDTGLGGG